MTKQYKLRFNDVDSMRAALATESTSLEQQVTSEKRLFASFAASEASLQAESLEAASDTVPAATMESLDLLAREYGADIVEDYQYELDDDGPDFTNVAPQSVAQGTMDDVLTMVKAREAWLKSRGDGIVIAIVDTGIDGTHKEFPTWKRAGHWESPGDTPWTDWKGHGTMCACISAATSDDGGKYNGIAPDAKVIACKTRFYDSELALIYDMLTDRARGGERIVASNSFGRKTGAPPPIPTDSDFIPALDDAIAEGVAVFFSAGNNHKRAGGSPSACNPNSIWLHKSRADLLSVATCNLDKAMWYYSSRGPGQHYGDANTNQKPDVTAPTPINGKVLYGSGERVLPNGWGTSGACPQAAGLAALLLSLDPGLTAAQVYDTIRNTAVDIGKAHECQGKGLIDCEAAVSRHLGS